MKSHKGKTSYVIGIVGGTGAMGRLFKKFFESVGHTVLISSRTTSLTPEACAQQSDIFIISVPIHRTVSLIEKLAPHLKSEALLIDFCSLKREVFLAMEKHAPCEFIAAHPIFGPSISSFKNQVVVLCPQKNPSPWLDFIKHLFSNAGMKIKITSADKHDKMMAIVQGLVHSVAINLVSTLERCDCSYDEIKSYSSPVYNIVMDFAARILNQSPDLYADIALKNPPVFEVLKIYRDDLSRLLDIIEGDDKDAYLKFFKQASNFLGEKNRQDAQKRNRRVCKYSLFV